MTDHRTTKNRKTQQFASKAPAFVVKKTGKNPFPERRDINSNRIELQDPQNPQEHKKNAK
jgi:hypothetical protein